MEQGVGRSALCRASGPGRALTFYLEGNGNAREVPK